MHVHDVAMIFPEMDGMELADLADDIRKNGLREDLWTYKGKLIDGRNRLKACEVAGVEPTFREWDGEGSLVGLVLSLNLHRRHLTASQRAAIGIEVKKFLAADIAREMPKKVSESKKTAEKPDHLAEMPKGADAYLPTIKRNARDESASSLGVSSRLIGDAEQIAEKSPLVLESVKRGEMTVGQAKRELGLTPPKPKGQCRLNGELVEDPEDIAAQRAVGRIPDGVIPVIDQPENPTDIADIVEEHAERAALTEDSLSDEDWLQTLPLYSRLSGTQRQVFAHNALRYRQAEPLRRAFAHGRRRLKPRTTDKLSGPYTRKIESFLSVKHPRNWLICPPLDHDGCGGTGVVPVIGECPKCKSKGFQLF